MYRFERDGVMLTMTAGAFAEIDAGVFEETAGRCASSAFAIAGF